MNMVVLLLDEMVFLAIILTGDGAGHVVAGVTDRLQFGNLTEHGSDLGLRIVAEVGIRYGVEILGDLEFHIIGDTFVFLDAGEELVEVASLRILLVRGTRRKREQFANHAEHALHTFGERLDFLLSLKHGELRRLHEASRNEVQAEVFFLVDLLRLDHPAYESLNLRDEPY